MARTKTKKSAASRKRTVASKLKAKLKTKKHAHKKHAHKKRITKSRIRAFFGL